LILVTGGTGFLGAHLLVLLSEKETQIRAIHRASSSFHFVKKVFQLYAKNFEEQWNKIEWIQADLLNIFEMEQALVNVKQVYHCAGEVSFDPRNKEAIMLNNANATAQLVNLCLEVKDIRFCHVSSIAAIGRSRLDEVISEDRFWKNDKNNSWYGITKYNAEREVWRGIEEGLNAVIINPSVILGYCNWDEGTGKMFANVWNGFRFYTDGVTGWVDVNDVAKAMIVCMENGLRGERFIINADNRPFRDVFSLIAHGLNKKEATIKATPFLTQIAYLFEKLRAVFTGKEPLISKETARSAHLQCYYDNALFIQKTGFQYTPLEQTISNTARLFLNDKNPNQA
jgi:nucleoside-diphosphate-sugar epimerase